MYWCSIYNSRSTSTTACYMLLQIFNLTMIHVLCMLYFDILDVYNKLEATTLHGSPVMCL